MTDHQEDTAIIPVERPVALGVLPATGPSDIIQQAASVATELAKIIKERKLFSRIQGKEFVRVEGWTTLGAMLGVLPREVSVLQLEDGGYEAVVELVRINDGTVIGRGSALCGMDEADKNGNLTWANRAAYARRSMAITRATGKAYRLGFSWIMALAGYEPTPAEEMPEVVEGEIIRPQRKPDPPPDPPFDPANPVLRNFDHLCQMAVIHLGYNHDAHVKNTLKKMGATRDSGYSRADLWGMLKEHQEDKGVDEKAAPEQQDASDDVPF